MTLAISRTAVRYAISLLCHMTFVLMSVIVLLAIPEVQAASAVVCPAGDNAPYPPFGNIDESPNVVSWIHLRALPANCHVSLQAPAALTIALAGRFTQAGSIEQIAARLGAISQTEGLPYWSVTDQDWRTLVAEAFAMSSQRSDAARADFNAREILSGDNLYFAQNDTRSWGLSTYRIRAIDSSPDHLVFESDNVSPIRIGPITLFEPGDVRSVLFINRLEESTWTYFSLAVIRKGSLAAREKSLINRQAAFYRFLIGKPPDQDPPLAP